METNSAGKPATRTHDFSKGTEIAFVAKIYFDKTPRRKVVLQIGHTTSAAELTVFLTEDGDLSASFSDVRGTLIKCGTIDSKYFRDEFCILRCTLCPVGDGGRMASLSIEIGGQKAERKFPANLGEMATVIMTIFGNLQGGDCAKADVAECVVYNKVFTESEEVDLLAYFRKKYAL